MIGEVVLLSFCFNILEAGECVLVEMPVSSGELMRQILDQFHLSQLLQEKVVFKLRDSRGALLPFSANLQSNDSSRFAGVGFYFC